MLKEPTRRVRYLNHDEADRLLVELPQHLRDMAAFSLKWDCELPTSADCDGQRLTWKGA